MSDRPLCGDCAFWAKAPPDPNNLGDVRGECVCLPPQVRPVLLPNGVGMMVGYPVLPPRFPGCAQFRPREGEQQNGEEGEVAA